MRFTLPFACIISSALAFTAANANDVPLGPEVEINGMKLAGVYIQPVLMAPEHAIPVSKADIHLEADIEAAKNNPQGFPEGSWIPYLSIKYRITKEGTDWKANGTLHPMAASDGPHYGDNVALDGPGKYNVVFEITPPTDHQFMHHIDKETGVAGWWKPFTQKYQFSWLGSTGKKGGY